MKPIAYAILNILSIFMLVGITNAHQQKTALTKVLFNHRTGNIEIMHRFYAHDAEHATQKIFNNNQADILSNTKTQRAFSQYVESQFEIKSLNDKALELKSVGFELEGKFFWVYQETSIPKTINGLKISNGALRELWPTQVNLVNIEGKDNIKSLTFSGQHTWLSVKF